MILDDLRAHCLTLPDTTEDMKWGDHMVFSVGAKMYCVVHAEPPFAVTLKATPEEAALLCEQEGIVPAPYLARAFWVRIERIDGPLSSSDLRARVSDSYALVRSKLPKRLLSGAAASAEKAPAKAVAKAKPAAASSRKAVSGAKPAAKVKPAAKARPAAKASAVVKANPSRKAKSSGKVTPSGNAKPVAKAKPAANRTPASKAKAPRKTVAKRTTKKR